MANRPRGDATPIKNIKGEYQPYPYGPRQKNSGSKLKQAKRLPGERKGYRV